MKLTPEAKSTLATTVRTLRESLLKEMQSEAESRFRLSLPLEQAGLAEGPLLERKRLETWLDEQVRATLAGATGNGKAGARSTRETRDQARLRHLKSAIKLAAATFLNRIVTLRQMEALELVKPLVVTGGWQSPGYREFRDFGPGLLGDDTEGYLTLLNLVFDELSLEMPGLFGNSGLSALFPVPHGCLRAVIEALDNQALESAWGDDTTLGWVYQFWNDPEREELDKKLDAGGKVEPHEIAAKTQVFTERYLVEWLLQNSIGSLWFAICKKNGWTPEVVAHGTLDRLEERRADWREKRERGDVPLEAMMPIEPGEEDRWKYWVVRPRSEEVVETGPSGLRDSREREGGVAGIAGDVTSTAPSSLREMKLLDPACGSGHFLIIAFDLLTELYAEEARHRGESWSNGQIARWIIENNLHGIDIDARAVQIAAAALMLKAWSYCRQVEPRKMNLVASNLGIASLPDDDSALRELVLEVQKSTGLPESLTMKIIHALKGADHLGSLLKVDAAVDEALTRQEKALKGTRLAQAELFAEQAQQIRGRITDLLDGFLAKHTRADDLGLRTRGEQLTKGVRFIQLMREGQYDLVVGNPPYLGLGSVAVKKSSSPNGKANDAALACTVSYASEHYPAGKADLYAAFIERSLQLASKGGKSALLTMRKWLFLTQFTNLRKHVLGASHVEVLCDLDRGAFGEILDDVVSVSMGVLSKSTHARQLSVFCRPTPPQDHSRDRMRATRKQAAVLCQVDRFLCLERDFAVVDGSPFIYWWDADFLHRYARAPKLGEQTDVRVGMQTSQDTRFLRYPWEVTSGDILAQHYTDRSGPIDQSAGLPCDKWVPFIKGAEGNAWQEPLSFVVRWRPNAMEVKCLELDGKRLSVPRNESYYFQQGVAFTGIAIQFLARLHRFSSVFGHKGSSVFPVDPATAVCLMNSRGAREVLSSLNPGLGFEVGDVVRLPLFPIESADVIVAQLDTVFTEHESHREASVEFKQPGPSAWRCAQDWAQRSVDRPAGEPLPPYNPESDPEPPTAHVSYAVGVALGRFCAHGEGILDQPPADALPHGILYLSAHATSTDSLAHPASVPILDAWEQHGSAITSKADLRTWLRLNFFADVHKATYENRPIYFPLSSAKRTFVAWISVHRWSDSTLQVLLADFLHPEMKRLDAELKEVLEARARADAAKDAKAKSRAEKRLTEVQSYREELRAFIDMVAQCAEKGAPQADPRDPAREVDARFRMDLDDGVMINSAALWPLLEPQWKEPKKWWKELCRAEGKKDYDWAHLAARYFPTRVDGKCKVDPSLAVAHGCFWKYHPEKACQWELRLQDEIGPDFTLDETGSDACRTAFETEHGDRVHDLREAEEKRRARKASSRGDGTAEPDPAHPGDEDQPGLFARKDFEPDD